MLRSTILSSDMPSDASQSPQAVPVGRHENVPPFHDLRQYLLCPAGQDPFQGVLEGLPEREVRGIHILIAGIDDELRPLARIQRRGTDLVAAPPGMDGLLPMDLGRLLLAQALQAP